MNYPVATEVEKEQMPIQPMVVLLVDDQPMVGEAVRRQLADEPNLEFHYTGDAIAALQLAGKIKPTVILQDIVMPNIDGFDAVRRFRANPATAETPIIMLSSQEDPETKSRAFGAGANDYIVKLPEKVELIARIRYHSTAHLNRLQRDAAYRALQESQQQLLNTNDVLAATNQQLEEAKQEAERANHAKSDFLSRMSHELRTPMNAILGFGQLLEMENPRPEDQENVAQILKAGRHLLDLINEVLDLSRIEAGRMSISLEPVPAGELMLECVQLIRPLAAQRKIRIECQLEITCMRHVLADRQRLKQVFLNLISNAVKYNRDAGCVTLSHEVAQDNWLKIKVADNGYGIPKQDMGRLFNAFERLGREGRAEDGAGLGLALSKRLVELMGGRIGLESAVDEGSIFWVELPLTESPALALERELQHHISKIAAPHPAAAPRKTVLYVEDNLSSLKLIERIFTLRPAFKLIAAMQGRLGLELAQEHHPDLVLLDLNLPDLQGGEVLRRLRCEDATSKTPVVIISADATPGEIERMLAAGATAYLTKPIDIPAFLKALDENLSEKENPGAFPASP
jgi:signal transduction histidine kinase